MDLDFFSFSSQGQVEASVRLKAGAPEDAEFYVVVRGSRLTHVTTAKRREDDDDDDDDGDGLTLCFTVPGRSFCQLCTTQVSLSA